MAIKLSDETLSLIEQRANVYCCVDVDEFIQSMLLNKYPMFEVDVEKLDPATLAALDRAQTQADIPWDTVRDKLTAKYSTRHSLDNEK